MSKIRYRTVVYISTALAMLILMSVVMVGCDNSSNNDQQRLATPQQVNIQSNKLVWQSVTNADYYKIRITLNGVFLPEKPEDHVYDNSFDLPTEIGIYTLSICAYTNSGNVSSYSNPVEYTVAATQLATPQQVRVDGNKLIWQAVPNANNYEVQIVTEQEGTLLNGRVNTTNFDLPTELSLCMISVRAMSTSYLYTNSEYSQYRYDPEQYPQQIYDIKIDDEAYNTQQERYNLRIGRYEAIISFDVSPNDAIDYTKTFRISYGEDCATIDNQGRFKVIDKTILNKYILVELSAGAITRSITIVVNYVERTEIHIKFDYNGGLYYHINGNYTGYTVHFVKYGTLLSKPTLIPHRLKYRFVGWTITKDGDDEFDFSKTYPIEWLTDVSRQYGYIYAKWELEV